MLNDEQLDVLSKGDISIYNLYQGSSRISRLIRMLTIQLANALLAFKEAREVLKEVEWTFSIGKTHCPLCANRPEFGHLVDCKLAKVLGEGE